MEPECDGAAAKRRDKVTRMANHYNVLFVCTNNAVRSIMAEAILNHVGMGRFAAYSAGSHPAARVHEETVRQLDLAQMGDGANRTKSWEMFAWPGTPRMDFVITLCAVAASRPHPQFPGNPILVHWPTPNRSGGGIAGSCAAGF